MTTDRWVTVSSRDAWEELYPEGGPLPLVQSWEWGEAKAQLGTRVLRLTQGRLGVQLMRRRHFAWAPGAPIGTPVVTHGALDQLAHQLRTPLVVSPHHAIAEASAVRSRRYLPGTVIVPLHRSMGAIRAELHKRWRNALSKAERADLQIQAGSPRELYRLLEPLAERKGFEVPYSRPFIECLKAELGSGFRIRLAVSGERPVAAWAETAVGGTVTYLLGASQDEGRTTNASYLLAWEAIERALSEELHFIDLGGAEPEAKTGPALFKKGMGGAVVRFPGTYIFGRGLRAQAMRAGLRLMGPRKAD
jgi:hypothetical protein